MCSAIIGLVLRTSKFQLLTIGVLAIMATASGQTSKRFPAEWEPHTRIFMVWPASIAVWKGVGELEAVRQDIANIAKAISKFEPVVMLVEPSQVDNASQFFPANSGLNYKIEIHAVPVDDLWARDTLPVFIEVNGEVVGVDFHFNGWGNKQIHGNDKLLAARVTNMFNLKYLNGPLVGEGGGLETDGLGTLLVTESSFVNNNRNPGKSRDQIEAELKETLGVTKVIWFKGVYNEDITDAHVDAFARFTSPGVVVVNRPMTGATPNIWSKASDNAMEVLGNSTDALGNRFTIVELREPDPSKITGRGAAFLASYVNYYVANGGIVIPRFNDFAADEKAKEILQKLYPTREIVQVVIDNLAGGGGGIHCATHDLPKPKI